MSLEQLGSLLFIAPPGGLGVVQLITEESDNEMIFESILTLTRNGLRAIQLNFADLEHNTLITYTNDRLKYIGYNIKVELVDYQETESIIHYCSISDTHFMLNKFHPYRLMEGMDYIPPSYKNFFTKSEYLHQIIAVVRLPEKLMVIRYFPVRLHFT